MSINIPFNIGSMGAQYNLDENIDKFFSIWENQSPQFFSEQIKKFNEEIKKNDLKVFIFLDEADRLGSKHIINFLIFSRILEAFDSVVCIIGLDYKQVLDKLIFENKLGLSTYADVKHYIDKFFLEKYHIHHSLDSKIQFFQAGLREIDNEFFSYIVSPNDYEIKIKLEKIVLYLSTPRQLKKLLISIKTHLLLIKHSLNNIDFLGFLACLVKHPVISENFSKHTLPILGRKYWFWELYVKDYYGIDCLAGNDRPSFEQVLICSMGIDNGENNDQFKNLSKTISANTIVDNFVEKTSLCFLIKSPIYLITLMIDGYFDEDKLKLYRDFFNEEINNVLQELCLENSSSNALAFDLSEGLKMIH